MDLGNQVKSGIQALVRAKPATAKGTYMRSVTLSTTHGPGVKVDTTPYSGQLE